jgi:hypothetical protein
MPADPFLSRKVGALSMAYALSVFRGLAAIYGDGQLGVIAQTISIANSAHIDLLTPHPGVAGPDAVLHDHARRPISVLKLSKLLGMPFETTRSQVNRLIEQGVCVRVDGGIIIPKSAMQRPVTMRAVEENLATVRQLVWELQAVGLDIQPPQAKRQPRKAAAPPG